MPTPPDTTSDVRTAESAPDQRRGRKAWFWRSVGFALMAIGLVGLGLPILPTVPFWILAAMAFAHGDPAMRHKLLAHPRVGPPLRAWFDHGIVSRKAKLFAISSMTFGASIGIWISGMGLGMAVVIAIFVVCVAVWLALRPEHATRSK